MSQEAFEILKGVESEFRIVVQVLDEKRISTELHGTEKDGVDRARAQCEKTYLLRLLAEFEGALERMGPTLRQPVTFSARSTLGTKLDRIGSNMGMDGRFRKDCDDRIRAHRNELAHGRSPVPRVSFDVTLQLMKRFFRECW